LLRTAFIGVLSAATACAVLSCSSSESTTAPGPVGASGSTATAGSGGSGGGVTGGSSGTGGIVVAGGAGGSGGTATGGFGAGGATGGFAPDATLTGEDAAPPPPDAGAFDECASFACCVPAELVESRFRVLLSGGELLYRIVAQPVSPSDGSPDWDFDAEITIQGRTTHSQGNPFVSLSSAGPPVLHLGSDRLAGRSIACGQKIHADVKIASRTGCAVLAYGPVIGVETTVECAACPQSIVEGTACVAPFRCSIDSISACSCTAVNADSRWVCPKPN
jgi:hypothetical protein